MSYEITEAARRDIKGILGKTLTMVGPHHLDVYETIIVKGILTVGDDPERGGSINRSEIALNVKLFHLELAAGRTGGASHCLYYTTGKMSTGAVGTIILRVLHEHMGPRYKVVRSLNEYVRSQTEDDCESADKENAEDTSRPK